MCLSVCRSVCQSVRQSISRPTVSQTDSESVSPFCRICLSSLVCVCLSVCISFCLSVSRDQLVSKCCIFWNETKISSPEHVFPSPFRIYPGRHRHSCPKSVFTQICSQGPSPLLLEHSLSSESAGMDKKRRGYFIRRHIKRTIILVIS